MKYVGVVLLFLGLSMLLARPVQGGGGNPTAPVSIRIALKSSQANPGGSVTVSGSGAEATLNVFVTLSPQAGTATGALVTEEVVPAADGTFSAVLVIPASTLDGIYAIRAEQFAPNGRPLQYYWNAFTVGAGGSGPLLPTAGASPLPVFNPVILALTLLLAISLLSSGMYAVVGGR